MNPPGPAHRRSSKVLSKVHIEWPSPRASRVRKPTGDLQYWIYCRKTSRNNKSKVVWRNLQSSANNHHRTDEHPEFVMISGRVQQRSDPEVSGKSSIMSTTHAQVKRSKSAESAALKSFLSGASSGVITCVLFQPMDLIKTRLQMTSSTSVTSSIMVNGGMINTNVAVAGALQRNGIINTITNVVRSESYRALWTGLRPSLYRTVPGVGMYFCTLNLMKTTFTTNETPTLLQNMGYGFTARSIVGTVMLPIAVIKTRYESGSFQYRSVSEALRDIWRGEGVRGLFSGWSATIARDAPYSGLYYMFYSKQKEMLTSARGVGGLSIGDNFMCGMSAGVLACMVTQPADVVKTQVQLNPTRYHGNMDCVVSILNGERGACGLLKGFVPRVLRKSIISAFSWTLFEQIMRWNVSLTKWSMIVRWLWSRDWFGFRCLRSVSGMRLCGNLDKTDLTMFTT